MSSAATAPTNPTEDAGTNATLGSIRPVTVHQYLHHEEHNYRASQIVHLMNINVSKATEWVAKQLGFDPWTRDLCDYESAFALVVSPDIYYDETEKANDFRQTLVAWLTAIFNMHYIYVDLEWRENSIDPDMGANLYEVDWCGSRHRIVNIGPHLFVSCRPRNTCTRRAPLDAAPATLVWPEGIPYRWTVRMEEPHNYAVSYKVLSREEELEAATCDLHLEEVD